MFASSVVEVCPFSTSPRQTFTSEPLRNNRTSRAPLPADDPCRTVVQLLQVLRSGYVPTYFRGRLRRSESAILFPVGGGRAAKCFLEREVFTSHYLSKQSGMVKLIEECFCRHDIKGVAAKLPKNLLPCGG